MLRRLSTACGQRYSKSAITELHVKSNIYSAGTTLEQVHIDEAVSLQPILSSASFEIWKKSHNTFANHGLKTYSFLRIVTGNPSILCRQPNKIIDSLEIWRSCQFGEQFLHLLLTKYPSLLDVSDGKKLLKHVTFLRGYVGTNKNVWKLLMNCPDLTQQSAKSISEKIEYMNKVMRIEIPEIVKSQALSKSLFEIQCRHVFLDRLGMFKPRSPKADPDEPTKNPRLYQITDTSDKKFATKIAHVTLAEYETFQELYCREVRNMDRDLNDEEEEEHQ